MTISELPLIIQTSYAELIDQLRVHAASNFPEGSTFRMRRISGKAYWYVQEPTGPTGRPPERYLGVDTPERREAIEEGRRAKADADGRKAIIRALKAAGLPEPDGLTSAVIDALAAAGVFRLRGVLVGTVAFQTYAGLLGVRLPGTAIRTGDVDLAQDYGVSVAVKESIDAPLLEVLKSVDQDFRPVPSIAGPNVVSAYTRPGGYRVDVLTTNRGAERDDPVNLPSLKTDAVALRFLDYLLRDTVEAAVLSRFGTLVNVPAPERYAVHKLIVSTLRKESGESAAKADKDIAQAGLLIDALFAKRRKADLEDVLLEAVERGPGWRSRLETASERLNNDQKEPFTEILSKTVSG
ncbi:MAG: GSU2403 family nucleotidyltransferase fold protein [Henriciella sp.]|uniref:nucleotidyltransferase family protein n=1 Tax=Henriciella sp. TaxID=1968823 RepID=UPI003C75DA50